MTVRQTTGKIRNNIIARKMAINAGLVVPPGEDPSVPEGVGLDLHEYRHSMLRIYRSHKRRRHGGDSQTRDQAPSRPQQAQEPRRGTFRRAWDRFKSILPTGHRR